MKKIISLLTTLSIVFGVLGTFTVFADETAADITEISTLAELEAFRDDVNSGNTYEGKTVKLTADIDMSEKYGEDKESWTPIGSKSNPFSGVFDGTNNKIDGLYINSAKSYQGLFGYISKGTIENLTVNGYVSSNDQIIGGIVAYSAGSTVSKCSFSGSVCGTYYIAGVVGWTSGGSVSDCNNSGTISAEKGYVGGVLGESNGGTVANCYNTGEISGKDSYIGGVAGWINCPLTDCYNAGSVIGKARTGGVVGNSGGTIASCYNTGTVTGTSGYTGGILGTNDNTVINCYNIGAVSGTNYVGGVIGNNGKNVINCYNVGTIAASGNNCIGGIAGHHAISQYVQSEMSNCYYLDTTASSGFDGTDTDGWVASKTAVAFADKSNFANWDFETVWDMDANLGRPVLRSNREEPPIETHTHTLVHHEAIPATCTETGTGEYWKCEGADACNKMFSDENGTTKIMEIPITAAIGHNYGAWSITTEPTFDATGKAERICENNNTHKEIVDLPVLTDTTVWTEDLKIEPTETENGLVVYTSQYGNVTIIIPALKNEYDYSIKYENEKAVVTVPQDGTYTVIFAAYDNGKLLSVSVQVIQLLKGKNPPISPHNFNMGGKVKVMLWDSLMCMKPLCASDGN